MPMHVLCFQLQILTDEIKEVRRTLRRVSHCVHFASSFRYCSGASDGPQIVEDCPFTESELNVFRWLLAKRSKIYHDSESLHVSITPAEEVSITRHLDRAGHCLSSQTLDVSVV